MSTQPARPRVRRARHASSCSLSPSCSARLAVSLGQAKDHSSAQAQEVSRLSRERGELEARVSELRDDHASLTNELVEAKLELARLREMEVRWTRGVGWEARREVVGVRPELELARLREMRCVRLAGQGRRSGGGGGGGGGQGLGDREASGCR